MQIFRYTTSIYGDGDTLTGASWDLLPWFVVASLAVIVLHALLNARAGHTHPTAPPDAIDTTRIQRHALIDRVYHWIVAGSVLVALCTAFLPIIGVKFAWLNIHWPAGIVLTLCVLFHIIRAPFRTDWRTMRPEPRDVVEFAADMRGHPIPAGKYTGAQKFFHLGIALLLLCMIASGLLMLLKIDTPFWRRDPYWFEPDQWGVIYAAHGLAAMAVLAMVMLHLYFALRPAEWHLLRSMLRGWISGAEYRRHHDTARWKTGATTRNGTEA